MSPSVPSFLLHIGPLRQESLAMIQQASVPGYVCIPQQSSDTQQALTAQPEIELQVELIVPKAERFVWHEYNLEEFNSLAPATGLLALYPGLTELNRKPVDTKPLEWLLESSPVAGQSLTHLVLEQPEQALALLKALNSAGALKQLTQLWVRTSERSLYEGMATQEELIQWCDSQGFEITPIEADDPEYQLLGFTRNALFKPLQAAKQKAKSLSAEIEALKQKNEQLARQCQGQVESITQAEQRLSQLKEERDRIEQQREDLSKAKEAAQKEVVQLTEDHETQKQQREEQAKEKAKALEQVELLKAERDQLKQAREELTKANEQAEKELSNAKTERDKLQAQLGQQKEHTQRVEAETRDTQQKQHKLEIELERAEAQLELIKELLLKDKLLSSGATRK